MLGWLLNLGFAGGGILTPSPFQEFVPFPVSIKRTFSETLMIKTTPVEDSLVKRTVSKDVER